MTNAEQWERQAERWAAWARRPEEAYWRESGPPFFELLPKPAAALSISAAVKDE